VTDATQTESCFSTLSQSHDVAAKGVKAYMSSIALPFARIANLDSLPRDRRRVKCWRLRRLHCIYLNESVGLCHGKSTASRRRGGRLSRKAPKRSLVLSICLVQYGSCHFSSIMMRSSLSCSMDCGCDAIYSSTPTRSPYS